MPDYHRWCWIWRAAKGVPHRQQDMEDCGSEHEEFTHPVVQGHIVLQQMSVGDDGPWRASCRVCGKTLTDPSYGYVLLLRRRGEPDREMFTFAACPEHEDGLDRMLEVFRGLLVDDKFLEEVGAVRMFGNMLVRKNRPFRTFSRALIKAGLIEDREETRRERARTKQIRRERQELHQIRLIVDQVTEACKRLGLPEPAYEVMPFDNSVAVEFSIPLEQGQVSFTTCWSFKAANSLANSTPDLQPVIWTKKLEPLMKQIQEMIAQARLS